MERNIVHLDLDAFFVSVERLRHPALRGIPLLIGGHSDRGVVAAASYEARKFGIHSAMPMRLARRLCPDAKIISGDMEEYSRMSHLVTEIIDSKVPLYEKSSIDEFYIDMTGMERFFGCARYAAGLKAFILKESGLVVSYALATNKLVSKVATNEVKPDGMEVVHAGQERSYLAPLAIDRMPMIGKKTADLLRHMGVNTIRLLSEIPRPMLENLLGRNGTELWRRAQGIDDTPIVPYREQKSISAENTFEQDVTDITWLKGQLVRLTERAGFELRAQGKLAGCITLKIRYADFDTDTRQMSIAYTAMDHVLAEKAGELFERLYDRRLRVRLIGVRLSKLVPGSYQIHLFDDTRELISLYQAIDQVKHKFGSQFISHAATCLPRIDEYRLLSHRRDPAEVLEAERLRRLRDQKADLASALRARYSEAVRQREEAAAPTGNEDAFMPLSFLLKKKGKHVSKL